MEESKGDKTEVVPSEKEGNVLEQNDPNQEHSAEELNQISAENEIEKGKRLKWYFHYSCNENASLVQIQWSVCYNFNL